MATVGELDAKALVDILGDKLSEIKARTLGYTLGHVDFTELFDKLAHTPAELQFEKPKETPCDVKAYALIDVLAYMLAGIKKNTHAGTPEETRRLRHWSRRWLIG